MKKRKGISGLKEVKIISNKAPVVVTLAAALLCVVVGFQVPVSAQDLTATEKKTLLEEIEKIEKLLKDGRAKNNVRVLSQLRQASASPSSALKFYLECVKEVDWESKGKRETDWREWRDGQAEFDDSGYAKAMQYRLRYMVLTIQASMLDQDDSSTHAKLVKDSAAFLSSLISNYKDVSNHVDVLQDSVLSGKIAEKTRLSDSLDKPNRWSETPLDIDGIYETTILPYYRSTGNATSLKSAWKNRISQLGVIEGTAEPVKISTRGNRGGGSRDRGSTRGTSSADREKAREERKDNAEEAEARLAEFKRERLPGLEWEMERDNFVFGKNKSTAARALGSHLRKHLDNASAPSWMAELKKLAAGEYSAEDYIGYPDEDA